MSLRNISLVEDSPSDAGHYVFRDDNKQLTFIPSTIECPYCHDLMREITTRPIAITRLSTGKRTANAVILPPEVKVYSCRACEQRFCVDTRQEGS